MNSHKEQVFRACVVALREIGAVSSGELSWGLGVERRPSEALNSALNVMGIT